MNKKITILIIAALLEAAIFNFHVFADDAVKQQRLNILNEMKKSTEIKQDNCIYRTEHFNVFTDKKSIEAYGIDNIKKFQASMLRICYIFEEAYKTLESMTNEEVDGKLDVAILEPGIFMKQYQKSDPYYAYYTGTRVWICIPKEALAEPLDNFENSIGSLYNIFAHMFCRAQWGKSMAGEERNEFAIYFAEIGKATSKWNNTLNDEEKQQVIDEIDISYTLLFKKHPDIFSYKEVNKVYMQCPWCHKEIDVTGKRKASRMKCPHCRKTITVEY
jgi:hypothetical protein